MATTRDYYEILGLQRGAGDDDIKRAFRKLAQQWHPDVNTDPDSDERFKEINEAYQVLSDPQRRQAYDLFGHAGVNGAGGEGYGPFNGFQGFGDIFDAFFGGAAQQGTRRGRPPAGADLRYDLQLTFDEAVHGTEKEINFTALTTCDTCGGNGAEPGTQPVTCPVCNGTGEIRQVRSTMLGQMVNITTCGRCRGVGRIVETPCHTCRGEGRVERKRTLRVAVPAGIDDGHQIRLSGEGEQGPRGGVPGNLYVVAHVAPHPLLKRQDAELFFDLEVSISQAALGARLPVPTPDGVEYVDVRPGSQPGTEIRLRGRGVPHLRRQGRGDLHVMLDVKVPTHLNSRQRELLQEFATAAGETAGASGAVSGEPGAPGDGTEPQAPRRRHRGLTDRIKDAIS